MSSYDSEDSATCKDVDENEENSENASVQGVGQSQIEKARKDRLQ